MIKRTKKIIKISQPACIQLYNAHIGYVDVVDQAVSTYKIRMQQKKWCWPIFSYRLSVAVNNAYQLMKRKNTSMTPTSLLKPSHCITANHLENLAFKNEKLLQNSLKL